MKVEVEQLSPVERKVSIEVPWETIKGELDLAYKGLAKRARLKGFRAGHVPRNVLERYYRDAVENEVINRVVDESFKKAISDHSLVPIDRPRMKALPTLTADQALAFSATVEVKPDVQVEHYLELEVVKRIRMVAELEIDAELARLRERAATVEPLTDRNVLEKGDLAVIDFFGYVDGETFKGGKGINYTIEVGSGSMITGFEDQLVGMTIGEQKAFTLVMPQGQGPAEVQGKPVEWKVDLKELKRKLLPTLDDDFAKDLGEFDTLADLRENLRKNIATREDARSRRLLRDQVFEKLVDSNPTDVPPVMVDRQVEYLLSDAMRMLKQQPNPALAAAIEKARGDVRPRAAKQVAGMLLLEAVARKEGVEIPDAELDARIADLARDNRMTPKQVKQQLRENDQLESLRYNLRQEKTLDLVVSRAKVVEQSVTAEEMDAAESAATGLADESGSASEAAGHDHDHDHDHHGHDHDHHGHDHDHHHG